MSKKNGQLKVSEVKPPIERKRHVKQRSDSKNMQ